MHPLRWSPHRSHRRPARLGPLAVALASATLVLALVDTAPVRSQTVDLERTTIALLTHKGGFAKGRAHDHVIVVGGAGPETAAELVWTGEPASASFRLSARAEDLEVDPEPTRSGLHPRLVELGLRSGELRPVDDDQRAEIRESMLGRKQLDAARFPAIGARLLELREEASTVGNVPMTHSGTVELTAHGETARVPFAGRVEREGDELRIEATGRLRFTDLGIEPFSAFLGAVKNLDEIDLYLLVVARAEPAS
jgi:hypothetical protein